MPVVEGLRAEGREFRGVIYVGLMLTNAGPKVIEFNVRFGDPETQVVLPMLQSDLLPLLVASSIGALDRLNATVRPEPCVGVVLASGGYPGSYRTGMSISGLDEVESLRDVQVFHSGTARREGQLVTAGGRVLTVVGSGIDYKQAIDVAYRCRPTHFV